MPARIRLATYVGVRRRDWRSVGLRGRVDEDAAHVYSSSHREFPAITQHCSFGVDRAATGPAASMPLAWSDPSALDWRDRAVRVADMFRMLGGPGRV